MLTPGVGLGDVPLGSCSHMTIRLWFTRKKLRKWRTWRSGDRGSTCCELNAADRHEPNSVHALTRIIGWFGSVFENFIVYTGRTASSSRSCHVSESYHVRWTQTVIWFTQRAWVCQYRGSSNTLATIGDHQGKEGPQVTVWTLFSSQSENIADLNLVLTSRSKFDYRLHWVCPGLYLSSFQWANSLGSDTYFISITEYMVTVRERSRLWWLWCKAQWSWF